MDIEIRLATEQDVDAIENLYNNLNDYLEETVNYPGWSKDIYPIRKDAVDGVRERCLYVAVHSEKIVGAMILRHRQEEAYSTVTWQACLEESQVLVIYTFAISPEYIQRGIGTKMLGFASELAGNSKIKALRLDVYEKNFPAIHLYEKCGYHYIDTVSLGLETCGLNWFKLYEKLLPN